MNQSSYTYEEPIVDKNFNRDVKFPLYILSNDLFFRYEDLTVEEYMDEWSKITSKKLFYYDENYADFYFFPPGYDDLFSYKLAYARQVYNEEEFGNDPPYLDALVRYTYFIQAVLCFIGIIVNMINIVIFSRMGLKDAFVVILFNISIADICYNFIMEIYNLACICDDEMSTRARLDFQQFLKLDLNIPIYHAKNFAFSAIVVNAALTTFLAVQRCLCVLMPLQFKGLFTWKKTTITTSVLWTFFIIHELPIICHMRLYFNTQRNWLSFEIVGDVVKYSQLRQDIDILSTVVVNWLCEIIVILCLLIMVGVLLKSVKFRQKASNIGLVSKRIDLFSRKRSKSTSMTDDKQKDLATPSKSLRNSKEMKVIVQVTLVSIFFIVTHLHYIISVLMAVTIPFYLTYPKYIRSTRVYHTLKEYLFILNSIVNLFVYLKYNSKYRQHFFRKKNK